MLETHDSREPEPSARGWKLAALKFAFAAALIWAMIHFGWLRLDVLAQVAVRPWLFLLAALLMLAGLLLTVVRWQALLAVQGVRPGAREVLRLGFIGFFFSCVIPGSVSGDAVKAWYVARRHGQTTEVITSVLLDRFIGLYTFMVAASAAIGASWWSESFRRVRSTAGIELVCRLVVALALVMTVFVVLALSKTAKRSRLFARAMRRLPFHAQLQKMHDAIYLYRSHKRALAFIILMSVTAQVPMILCNYALGKVLGDSLPISSYFFLASVGLVINSLPVLPGGLGTGEAGYRMLFSAFGSGVGAEVAALWHVLFFAWSIIGLLLYLKGKAAYQTPAGEPQPQRTL